MPWTNSLNLHKITSYTHLLENTSGQALLIRVHSTGLDECTNGSGFLPNSTFFSLYQTTDWAFLEGCHNPASQLVDQRASHCVIATPRIACAALQFIKSPFLLLMINKAIFWHFKACEHHQRGVKKQQSGSGSFCGEVGALLGKGCFSQMPSVLYW